MLLDDDFATIVAAVEQGRATFANIRRFLTYHLTDNVAELTPFVVWALSGGASRWPSACSRSSASTSAPTCSRRSPSAPSRRAPTCPDAPAARRTPDRPARCSRRVFGVLGPAEACVEMAAFVAVLWPAAGGRADRCPSWARSAGGLGRGLRGGRHRPGGERLRLPRHGQLGRRARLDDEPATARRRRRRNPAPRPHALRGAGGDAPWPGGTNGARLGDRRPRRSGGPARRRGAQAFDGHQSANTIARPMLSMGPRGVLTNLPMKMSFPKVFCNAASRFCWSGP